MNDYSFGNRILELREGNHLSQAALAKQLGVTAKAVSKWETGASKPKTDMIRKLAALFDVPIDDLLLLKEGVKKKSIIKIAITGGPCAGKTIGLDVIQAAFEAKGYTVLCVPEIATELISSGVAPWTCSSNVEFQKCQMKLQIEKEKIFEYAAETMDVEKILIICDRGTLDSKAYMGVSEFALTLQTIGENEVELRERYDAVFHLVTAAKGAEEHYTLSNNKARRETREEAAILDDKLIAAWTGHPHLKIIDTTGDFESKMEHLISEISIFLSKTEPYELGRKFLIKYPDVRTLEAMPYCERIEIIQTFLKSNPEEERSIKQRGCNGHYVYYETIRKFENGKKKTGVERRLSKDEYLTCLMDADPTKRPVRKDRYCLMDEYHYFMVDIYPFWGDRAIVEIENSNTEEKICFPKVLKVIKEVTNDDNYDSCSLARI